jgi:type IV pilus assembly protein PilA
MRTLRPTAGFTLIELMIVIAIIAIIAAIAIPNLLESRKASNEASAIQTLRSIASAQIIFRDRDYNKNGRSDYADGSSNLQGLLPAAVVNGGAKPYNGYQFGLLGTGEGIDTNFEWAAICAPESFGRSGDRSFFTDESGVIRFSTTFNIDAGIPPITPADIAIFRTWPPIGG